MKTPKTPRRGKAGAATVTSITVTEDGRYRVHVDTEGRSASYTVRALNADVAARYALWRFRQLRIDGRNPWL